MKLHHAALWLTVTGLAWGQPQSPAPLAFEVVSVKRFVPAPGTFLFRIPTGKTIPPRSDRYSATLTLNELIMTAYEVKGFQILGLPAWAVEKGGEQYQIVGKSNGVPTLSQLKQMQQALAEDRFQLKLHREQREIPIYAVTVAKNGSKLREVTEAEANAPMSRPPGPGAARPTTLQSPILQLLWFYRDSFDRPLIDRTGLTGYYEYTNVDSRSESLAADFQRELGLKLEPRSEPYEVLVIDRAERPSAN